MKWTASVRTRRVRAEPDAGGRAAIWFPRSGPRPLPAVAPAAGHNGRRNFRPERPVTPFDRLRDLAKAAAARAYAPYSRFRVGAVLLSVVAEKTGYPVESLGLGLSLDADLGVDSIKRVEILSALRERLPGAPEVKPEHLGTLRLAHRPDTIDDDPKKRAGAVESAAGARGRQ